MKLHKDCPADCPGDPLCEYTELSRIWAREEAWPYMKRLQKVLPENVFGGSEQGRWEQLYRAVCAVMEWEVMLPVDGYKWPYRLPEHYRRPE